MAKRRTSSRSQNSASAPASAAASTKSPTKSTNGRRVLSVKKAEQMKSPALKQSKRNSVRKCKTTRNNKRAKIDALKPKKPPTAFFYFLEDFRKEFQEKNPDIKSMRDIGKACGEKWKTMTYEEKVQYYDIATEKRAEFDRAMADYMKQKESGDFQEYEDELEF